MTEEEIAKIKNIEEKVNEVIKGLDEMIEEMDSERKNLHEKMMNHDFIKSYESDRYNELIFSLNDLTEIKKGLKDIIFLF